MANKILIIDEEKWYMEAIFDRIDSEFGPRMYDYTFNGSAGIDMLARNSYAVIILDLMLPLGEKLTLPDNEPDLMYGVYILRKIRELNKSIPVLCYTVLDDTSIKEQLVKLNGLHICKLEEDSYNKLFTELKSLIG